MTTMQRTKRGLALALALSLAAAPAATQERSGDAGAGPDAATGAAEGADPSADAPRADAGGARALEAVPRVAEEEHLFVPSHWAEHLGSPDLDLRERAFELLVERARHDLAAREALEAWARDGERRELAWTARMALRELRRPAFGLVFRPLSVGGGTPGPGVDAGSVGGRGGSGRAPSALNDALNERLRELAAGADVKVGHGRLEQRPDGVRLHLVEIDGDVRIERTLSADSLESILAQQPDLRRRLGAYGLVAPEELARAGARGGRPLEVTDPEERGQGPRTDLLGVEVRALTASEAQALELGDGAGLRVVSTLPGTIAHELGLKGGDVLLAIDGHAQCEEEDVTRAIRRRDPRAPLRLEVVDGDGRRRTLTWTPQVEGGGR